MWVLRIGAERLWCPQETCIGLSKTIALASTHPSRRQGSSWHLESGWHLRLFLDLEANENFCPLQRSFGPFGLEVAKRVRNELPGPLSVGGPKSPKRSRKRVKIVEQESILVFDSVWDFLDPQGREALGTYFGLFWPLWAWGAQMTAVAGPENLKLRGQHANISPKRLFYWGAWVLYSWGRPGTLTTQALGGPNGSLTFGPPQQSHHGNLEDRIY